jgi:hypothetical protein
MDLENDLKELGAYLDFHRNREVVQLRFTDFLKLIRKHSEEMEKEAIDAILQAKIEDENYFNNLKSMYEAKEYTGKTASEKLLTFIGLLGETFAREPTALVKHIALILKAQKEKW